MNLPCSIHGFADEILLAIHDTLKNFMYDVIHTGFLFLSNYIEEVFEVALHIDRHCHLMRGIGSVGVPDRFSRLFYLIEPDCALFIGTQIRFEDGRGCQWVMVGDKGVETCKPDLRHIQDGTKMMVSARAMKAGLAKLQPSLKQTDSQSVGTVALGTVKGDLHDMGKNLVGMMLEGAGFKVKDLGVDVSPEAFVAAADEVDVIGLSALLTTTMGHMKDALNALDAAGKRAKVKVIVGGAPVTEDFARQIGADGYAPDASRAVALAKSLIAPSA